MKVFRLLSSLFLLVGLVAFLLPASTLAQDEPEPSPTPIPEELQINTKYPKLEVSSGETAKFDVELILNGELGGKERVFDLVATAPKDWTVTITPQYPEDKKIVSIQLQPGFTTGERIYVNATPAYWLRPEPGEYLITLVATSGGIKGSVELKAVVTAKYALSVVPANEYYSTNATAGEENFFSIDVQNIGYSPANDISFSSDKPENWTITFSPNKIDTLTAGNSQTVEVSIKPPPKTIAGDYLVTLKTSAQQTTAPDVQVRVTVQTPTVWGWIGVIIVAVVIVGLVFTFRQFSRR